MSIFKDATRLKLRFKGDKGTLSVEDLWDLPLKSGRMVSLDSLAKAVNRKIKADGEESFVDDRSPTNAELDLKLDILKEVISIRKDENLVKTNAAANKAKRDKILSVKARKEDSELENLSIEELDEMLKLSA